MILKDCYIYRNTIRAFLFLYRKAMKISKVMGTREFILQKDYTCGEIVEVIKPRTVEKIQLLSLPNILQGGNMDICFPEINMCKYNEAYVCPQSDIIKQEGIVHWQKYYYPQFTKNLPADRNLIKMKGDRISVYTPSKKVSIKKGYSLCGVHSDVWSHFLIQYLPKLYILPKLLEDIDNRDELTVITPIYRDLHIQEIVYSYLKELGLKHVGIKNNEVAFCEVLYYVNNTSIVSDHAKYISPLDILVPKIVSNLIKENLTNSYKKKVGDINVAPYKIYIDRKSSNRGLVNGEGIKKFFVEKGYIVIEPHKLTLEEKVKLFMNASVVVGPGSSGFSNLIFSNSGTVALAFVNFQRVNDLYPSFLARDFGINFHYVTGIDINPENPHSDYMISIDRIASICKALSI